MFDALRRDIHFAMRTLRRRPVFASMLVLTLALGIGGATTVFTVVDAVLIRDLPFRDASSLVSIWRAWPSWQGQEGLDYVWDHIQFDAPGYLELERDSRTLSHVEAVGNRRLVLTDSDRSEEISVGLATAGFFDLLGVSAGLGRTFAPDEGLPAAPVAAPVAVLSHDFWRARFGGDRDILGRSMVVQGRPHVVIGVLPPRFRWTSDLVTTHENGGAIDSGLRDVWIPLDRTAADCGNCLEVVARLGTGFSIEQARAEAQRLLPTDGGAPSNQIARVMGRGQYLASGFTSYLLLLLGASVLLLMIACLNSAGLLVGDSASRRREIAVRSAIGAARGRLVRQLITENAVLGVLGALLGAATAWIGTQLLVLVAPPLPRLEEIAVNGRALTFAISAGLGTGVLFGTAPAIDLLRSRSRVPGTRGSTPDRRTGRIHADLVTMQACLSVVLLVAGGLLARSLARITSVDPGFAHEDLTVLSIRLPADRAEGQAGTAGFQEEILGIAAAVPGVVAVSGADDLPLSGGVGSNSFSFSRDDSPAAGQKVTMWTQSILPDYFATIGIRVLQGRSIERSDRSGSQRVAVVSRSAAERMWPGEPAVGRLLKEGTGGGGSRVWTVVGVVDDVKHRSLTAAPEPTIYRPATQVESTRLSLVARTAGGTRGVSTALQRALWRYDPDIPIVEATTMGAIVRATQADTRLLTLLVWTFASAAALLASVGVFGVTAQCLAARRREIGIRMALGATRGQLARLIVRTGMGRSAIGVVIGLGLAAAVGGVLGHLLFDVGARDPLTYAVIGTASLTAFFVAGYLPARRVSAIDPTEAMRAGQDYFPS